MKKWFCFLVVLNTLFFGAENGKVFNPHKTIFITGGAGFIGSNFLGYMFDKYPDYHFIILDALTYAGSLDNIPHYIRESPRFQFIYGSITDLPLVDQIMNRAHFVVHFAAETHVTKSIAEDHVFFETNVMGTRAMLAALVKHAKTVERFVHISSSEVYGTADYEPIDEEHLLKPRSPYAASKAGADRLVHAYGCTFDIPVVTIRLFNNYGPKQHEEKLIPHFIYAVMHKEPLTIHGTGNQKRDWIHTTDVSIAIDKVLHTSDFLKMRNQEINIGTGKAVSVLEIAKMLLKYFKLPETELVFLEERPGQVQCHIASIEKAKTLLDWSPSIDLEDGLKSTIKWYVDNDCFLNKQRNEK